MPRDAALQLLLNLYETDGNSRDGAEGEDSEDNLPERDCAGSGLQPDARDKNAENDAGCERLTGCRPQKLFYERTLVFL